MIRAKIIPDRATAERLASDFIAETADAKTFSVFQYQQPRSGLTLFGASIRYDDGGEGTIIVQP